jgi:glycogen debranching enzyme
MYLFICVNNIYYRGPIWIPINYLALKALKHYGTADISLTDVIEKVEYEYNIENSNLSKKKKKKKK